MSNNRKLGNLAQFLDSGSTKSVITASGGAFATEPLLEADLTGTAPTGLSDSNLVKNLVDINYITETAGYASVSDAIPVILQNTNNIIPDSSGVYDLGDSAKPIAELILDSSANIFFGALSLTSLLKSGTSSIIAASGPTYYGDRGVWASGNTDGGVTNIMDYIDITTPGNATDFGDLQTAKRLSTGCSNVTRGLFAGGYTTTYTNEIDYIAIATTGNATDFGNLTLSRWTAAAASDGTYGVFGGGYNGSSSNVIDYVTIATPADASDFGDLIAAYRNQGSCSSGTYGVWGGGYTTVAAQAVQYVTIATTGNASNPGSLTQSRYYLQATSNETYGLWAGGQDPTVYNIIDYVTFASLGNATDFGDLTTNARDLSSTGCSNGTYAVFSGGEWGASPQRDNRMEYVSIATPGNATDFGDRTIAAENSCGTSGSPS